MSVTIGIVVFVSWMVWALDPEVQAGIDSSDTIYRTTRASLDVGGGQMTGPSGFRFRETSLGSAIQTGLTEGEFRITSGFIQRTSVSDEVEPLVGDFNGTERSSLMIFSFLQRLLDRWIRSLTSIGTEKSILTISLFSPETSG